MSDGATEALFTTAIFNPALLRKEDLVRGFIARQDLLDRLLADLRGAQTGTPPQHQIVIGQRGLGKTTLLRRLAFGIEDDPQLSALWLPLVFPEEQYNVKRLGDFWLNCADALSDALDRLGDKSAAEKLDQKVTSVPSDPGQRSAAALALLVDEAARLGRGLVLLVDNLDIVLDRLNNDEEWEFRRVISSEHRLYFIGASSRALEALYDYGRAFFDFFQVLELKGLTDEEMLTVLSRLAEQESNEAVQKLVREKPERIRALRVLTGGNPRTLMLLYRILSEGPEGDVQRDIEQLLDLYTPLYKARFEEMAPQSQQVVDAMAIHWDPLTAAELAEKLAPLSVNQVSALLKRLEDFGVVEKTPWFGEKKAAFQISERFFNIWYLMRASRRVRRRLIWLVQFLESWFERGEICDRARLYLQRDPEMVGAERYAEMALAYSQTVDDPRLRRGLESAGLRAALDARVGGQFDFSDLPPEVQNRKARMERLRALRSRVLSMHLEVDKDELWRLLGGSPHLSLEEKARIVEDLPGLQAYAVRDIYVRLERTEQRLKQTGPKDDSILRLYEALASGEITDVYDLDGTLALAERRGCRWLPELALESKANPALMPEDLSEAELRDAERAWRALSTEPGHEARGWNGLANLVRRRSNRYEEAEAAYRRAIDVDPHGATPWNNLGLLLQHKPGQRDDAERAYRRAIELDHEDYHPWANLGNLLAKIPDRFDEAESAYRQAIALNDEAAFAWNGLGILLRKGLRILEAEQAFRRAIELDPLFSSPWSNLGNLLKYSKKYDEAEGAFRRSIFLDLQNPYPWNGLGNLLQDYLARYGEAEQSYRRAIELDSQFPYAWGNLARLLEHHCDRLDETLEAYFKAAELDPTSDWRKSEALRFARSVGTKPASAVALQAVSHFHELFPDDWETEFVLAGFLALNDDWSTAKELLTNLCANESAQPDNWTFGILLKLGHLDEMIELMEQASADERWRPLYEALKAVQAGSQQYLRRVAPEVRNIAEKILSELAPAVPN